MLTNNLHTQPVKAAEEEKQAPSTFVACSKCYSEITPGKQHRCTEAGGVAVLSQRLIQLGENFGKPESPSYQRVASSLTTHQMQMENISPGEKFKMATAV